MNARLSLLVMTLFLASCDDRQAEVEAPPPAEPEEQAPATPLSLPPIGEPMIAPVDIPLQSTEPAPVEPAALPEPEPVAARPVARAPKVTPAEPAPPEATADLDLSLPEQWGDELLAEGALDSLHLLPPLFDKRIAPSVVQIGGRLIASEFDDDITGAEIQIEIRR